MSELIPRKTAELKAYGFEDAEGCSIKLDANESFVSLPLHLREKLAEITLYTAYNRYPDPLSQNALEAYSAYIGVPSEFITAGNGSDELISVIIGSLLNSGSKLLLSQPDFSMYSFYAGLCEVICIDAEKKDEVFNDVVVLKEAVKRINPTAVILSNPCSPTGTGLSRCDILELTKNSSVLWVIDEAYMDFWDQTVVEDAIKTPNLIVLRTCSKAFGLASLRLGFAICCNELTQALRRAKSPANVNSLTNAMAAAVISDKRFTADSICRIKKSSQNLYKGLVNIADKSGAFKVAPSVTNFVYIMPLVEGFVLKAWEHLKSVGIIVRKLPGGLRVTAGTDDENEAVLIAIDNFVSQI